MPSTWNGSFERVEHAVGDGERHAEAGRVGQQDRELVATEARDDVAGAQRIAHAVGDGDQQLVAGGVAQAVVDQLEVVEIEEQHDRLHARVRRASSVSTRSLSRLRLASPVSGSWYAW